MKKYEPKALVAVSRYQNYLPSLPTQLQRDVYARMDELLIEEKAYSELSVAKARDYNRDMIAAGRCDVQQGDASDLAFPDASFDLATAFETVYFWPGLEKCFKQVFRVLRPGGVFMICNESDGTDPASKKFESIRLETSLQFRRHEVLHGTGAGGCAPGGGIRRG